MGINTGSSVWPMVALTGGLLDWAFKIIVCTTVAASGGHKLVLFVVSWPDLWWSAIIEWCPQAPSLVGSTGLMRSTTHGATQCNRTVNIAEAINLDTNGSLRPRFDPT